MTDNSKRYSRSSFPTLVYCGNTHAIHAFVRDSASWEDFNEDTIQEYMNDGAEMLTASLTSFVKKENPYSSLRAKELRFMLEALIEVKEVFTTDALPVLRRDG